MNPPLDTVAPFSSTLQKNHLTLGRKSLETLQINVGKFCNQACRHCHVEAGPTRKEIMEEKTVERILELLQGHAGVHTVDITGGAPELNPYFRRLVREVSALGIEVIDRCNLTVFFEEGQEDTPEFLRKYRVKIVASLPCYSRDNVDKQRGRGVFDKSIRALQHLNTLGYGKEGSNLVLDLVYNPLGAFLPPNQEALEAQYKEELRKDLGIEFNRLYTITNMPIKRFLWDLEKSGKLVHYMTLLVNNFNSEAAKSVMCRNLLSVGWDGQLYDCDFNQMLEIPVSGERRTIWDIRTLSEFDRGSIAFDQHCYGCTAGAGSSCGGSIKG